MIELRTATADDIEVLKRALFEAVSWDPERELPPYELAVAVCNADGVANEAEQRFLAGLRALLGISAEATAGFEHDVQELAGATVAPPAPAAVERRAA